MKTWSLELSAGLACIWKGSHCSMHHLLPLKMLINHKLNCNQNHWNFNQELQCRLSLSQVMSCLMLTSDFKFEKSHVFDRQRDMENSHSLLHSSNVYNVWQMFTITESCQSQKPWTQSAVPLWVAETQLPEESLATCCLRGLHRTRAAIRMWIRVWKLSALMWNVSLLTARLKAHSPEK